MDKLLLNSHAKINLTLDVLGRRPDGYHDVRMIMAQCGLCDSVLLERSAGGVTTRTNLGYLPSDERNTAYKAARLFFEHTGLDGGVDITLKKRIPVSAGLAGGSGNAAAVLVGLNRLFGAGLPQETLLRLGEKVGADVPYCIAGGTMLAEGIGERLTPLPPLPRTPIVIVRPNLRISTAQVYARIDSAAAPPNAGTDAVAAALARRDVAGVAANLFNVMEAVTAVDYPIIGRIKQKLMSRGALGAVMSGSGSAVYGLFADYRAAKSAAGSFRPGSYFVYAGWTR